MKKYFFLPLLAMVMSVVGCDTEEFGPVYKLGNAPNLTSPSGGASFVLKEDDAAKEFAKFTWTAAEFGFEAGTSYTLEMDLKGNNFKDPVNLGTVNALELSGTTVEKINTALFFTKNRPAGEPTDVEFRVRASVSKDVQELISAPLAAKVTPYAIIIVYPQLQVPGSYQGWKPEENSTIIFSAAADNRYEGYIYFPAGTEYKYTEGPTWAKNWGDNGADGTLEKDGANIKVADEGLYRLRVNLNNKTHDNMLTRWGVIGSATAGGWDSDQDMTFDASNNKLTVKLNLTVGEIKFRANDDWAVNYGDNGANRSLEYGGDNIKIEEAGNYTIDLILSGAIPTYKLTKN